MSIKNIRVVQCDHVSLDGITCGMRITEESLQPGDNPFYHLRIEVSVIDDRGETQMVSEDIHVCYWDLYHHLSAIRDRAKSELTQRKRDHERGLEAQNNDE